jgi:hypothetical protein
MYEHQYTYLPVHTANSFAKFHSKNPALLVKSFPYEIFLEAVTFSDKMLS